MDTHPEEQTLPTRGKSSEKHLAPHTLLTHETQPSSPISYSYTPSQHISPHLSQPTCIYFTTHHHHASYVHSSHHVPAKPTTSYYTSFTKFLPFYIYNPTNLDLWRESVPPHYVYLSAHPKPTTCQLDPGHLKTHPTVSLLTPRPSVK